jgi:UDPglucose 6-dehydrogenase
LISTAKEYHLEMPIVKAARDVNYRQREVVIEKLLNELKILKGRTIGLLGLAFKPNTDDLREAPALQIAESLISRGAKVRAHDPVAMDHARRDYPDLEISYCGDIVSLARGADALVMVTEWQEYSDLPWKEIHSSMRNPLLLDGRNFLDRASLNEIGFRYLGVGW